MTTIDNIVSQYNINKIDMIRLDVEVSEEKSLLGGIKTIVKHRPKLLISLYHKHNDIFELPLFIDKLNLNYKFCIGHHRQTLQETVLYAISN
jgi:Leucine-rich repeat (LRR) protein